MKLNIISEFILYIKYYLGHEVKQDETIAGRNTNLRDDKCIISFILKVSILRWYKSEE
jgi:hypothetical protein